MSVPTPLEALSLKKLLARLSCIALMALPTAIPRIAAASWADDLYATMDPAAASEVKVHSELVNEAHTYLDNCNTYFDPLTRNVCNIDEGVFIERYVSAYYGDYHAAGLVRSSLARMGIAQPEGVEENQLQACAWALAILYSGSPGVSEDDNSQAASICGPLSDSEKSAASDRSNVILRGIQKHMTKGDFPKQVFKDVD